MDNNKSPFPAAELSPEDLTAEVVEVDPSLATQWLEHNDRNRPLSTHNVKRFSKMMAEGNWLVSQDAIAFDWNGSLINGQNRLHAIIDSGTTQTFVVVKGLSPEAFLVMDYGKKRSAGDALAVRGYKRYKNLAAAGKLVWVYEHGLLSHSRVHVENAEIVDMVEAHDPRLPEAVEFVNKYKSDVAGLMRLRHLAFVYFVYSFRDSQKTEQFVHRVATGLGISNQYDPIKKLRDRFIKESQGPGGLIEASLERALMIKACNKSFRGEEVKYLRWSPGQGEDFPLPDVDGYYPMPSEEAEENEKEMAAA